MHNAFNEGRLKFAKGKTPMKIDSDPLHVVDVSYVELAAVNMVEITEDFNMDEFEESGNKIEAVFPKAGESFLEFLYRCQVDDSEVMVCPRCSAMFDKKAAKKVESAHKSKEKENEKKYMPQNYFKKRGMP